MTLPIAAVLFDMDGTLVDSDAAVDRAWAYWSRVRGVDPTDIAGVAPGRPALDAIADLAPWLSPAEHAADAAELLQFQRADLADVVATPGTLDLIEALDMWTVPYAVVTSADLLLARARLSAAGIALPPVVITSSDTIRGKPDPQGYLLAADRLGVQPQDCLVVEDSIAGVRAGRAAAAVVAGLRDVPEADLNVPDLGALRALLRPSDGKTAVLALKTDATR
jgi:sugar-phosphatase